MASESNHGSTNLVQGGGETSLVSKTSAGVYGVLVDLNAMAAGDEIILRLKAKARAADATRRLVFIAVFKDAQSMPIAAYPPMMVTDAEWTAEQPAGTGRTITWSLITA